MGMIKSDFLEQILEIVGEEVEVYKSLSLMREGGSGEIILAIGLGELCTCEGGSPLAQLFGFIEESADMGQGDILSFGGDKDNLQVFICRDGQELEYSKEDILEWATGEDSPTGE